MQHLKARYQGSAIAVNCPESAREITAGYCTKYSCSNYRGRDERIDDGVLEIFCAYKLEKWEDMK